MKTLAYFTLIAVLVLAGSGCKTSRGPGFNTNADSLFNDTNFVELALSNNISAEMLKRSGEPFRLGPGDVVDLRILGDALSRATTLVGPDGRIYFNILKGVSVWGLTLSEAKALLEAELAKELKVEPSVAINLRDVKSRRIWIMGQVQAPGVYDMPGDMTLLEAVSTSGGFAAIAGSSEINADLRNSFVLRGNQRINVDFERLIHRGDLSQNIHLQSDDFVFFAPSQVSDVFVLGAVSHAANVPYLEPMTLVRAITSVGGVVKYAHDSQVAIIRGSLNSPRIATVDYKAVIKGQARDVVLQPGDLVYVPFVPYKKVAEFADDMLRHFVGTIAINEGRNAVSRGSGPVGVSVGVTTTAPAAPISTP